MNRGSVISVIFPLKPQISILVRTIRGIGDGRMEKKLDHDTEMNQGALERSERSHGNTRAGLEIDSKHPVCLRSERSLHFLQSLLG